MESSSRRHVQDENTRVSNALSRLALARSSSSRSTESRGCLHREDGGEDGTTAHKVVELLSWVCSACYQACMPIRSESRCLCGHRLKEHDKPSSTGACRCSHAKCVCKSFFFVPAEGSWILRCRCKHRHTDHDPMSHACCKPACECNMFHSPWVCNCNHAWSQHQQVLVQKNVPSIASMMADAGADVSVLAEMASSAAGVEVNQVGWDMVNRGDA